MSIVTVPESTQLPAPEGHQQPAAAMPDNYVILDTLGNLARVFQAG